MGTRTPAQQVEEFLVGRHLLSSPLSVKTLRQTPEWALFLLRTSRATYLYKLWPRPLPGRPSPGLQESRVLKALEPYGLGPKILHYEASLNDQTGPGILMSWSAHRALEYSKDPEVWIQTLGRLHRLPPPEFLPRIKNPCELWVRQALENLGEGATTHRLAQRRRLLRQVECLESLVLHWEPWFGGDPLVWVNAWSSSANLTARGTQGGWVHWESSVQGVPWMDLAWQTCDAAAWWEGRRLLHAPEKRSLAEAYKNVVQTTLTTDDILERTGMLSRVLEVKILASCVKTELWAQSAGDLALVSRCEALLDSLEDLIH